MLTSACSHKQIPSVRVYKEIPFIDAPEGVFVNTLKKKDEGIINATEWAKIAPFMICVDPDGWEQIKLGWLQACRLAPLNGEECNAMVNSVETTIRKLDALTRSIMKP